MSQSAIFFPVLVQAVLSLMLLPVLGVRRARSMREHRQQITDKDVELGRNAWTGEATKAANNYRNQFELPVLFFAVVAFALILKQADPLMIGLAWAFAATRLVHAAIHVGPNVVRWRALAFIVGAAVLLTMWLVLGWRIWAGA